MNDRDPIVPLEPFWLFHYGSFGRCVTRLPSDDTAGFVDTSRFELFIYSTWFWTMAGFREKHNQPPQAAGSIYDKQRRNTQNCSGRKASHPQDNTSLSQQFATPTEMTACLKEEKKKTHTLGRPLPPSEVSAITVSVFLPNCDQFRAWGTF